MQKTPVATRWQMGTHTGLHKDAYKNHTTNNAKSQRETGLEGISIDQQLRSTARC